MFKKENHLKVVNLCEFAIAMSTKRIQKVYVMISPNAKLQFWLLLLSYQTG